MEEWISELEYRVMEITQTEQEKKMRKKGLLAQFKRSLV